MGSKSSGHHDRHTSLFKRLRRWYRRFEVTRRGAWGERRAARALKKEAFLIFERNWRSRRGELDIIACRGGTISFIEVKTRLSGGFNPWNALDAEKYRRIFNGAQDYWMHHGPQHCTRGIKRARFEVMIVTRRHGRIVVERHEGSELPISRTKIG